jgi:hypothetical protein
MEKMQNSMMKHYKMFAAIGLIIVVIAFGVSLLAADANSTFFSATKEAREGSDSTLIAANVTRNVIQQWVPALKFVGLGLMLGAITMALGIIATTLREFGIGVMSRWPKNLNPGAPDKPRAAKMFPMLMIMGWMLLLVGLIVALASNGTVSAYWNNSIALVLNPAGLDSIELQRLGFITGIKPWLGALRFAGMALLFTAITVAVTVMIRTLQAQERNLRGFVKARTAVGQ